MEDRASKLALALLFLNVMLVVLGMFAFAWEPAARALGASAAPFIVV